MPLNKNRIKSKIKLINKNGRNCAKQKGDTHTQKEKRIEYLFYLKFSIKKSLRKVENIMQMARSYISVFMSSNIFIYYCI